jgi:hypothetical protein
MTAAGAGAAAGVSWIDVAASAAGIYHQMAAVGQQAASGFSQAFNSEWAGRAQSAMKLGGNVTGDFAALGTEAANTFVGQFTRVLQGGVPDPKAFFDLFEHGIDDMVNDVVAKVPLIGPAFQKAYSVVQPIVDSFVGITGEMGQAVEELGAQWMEMSRTFAENTVDAEGLARLMTVTQQIAESGAVVSLKDVSESIGLINQRIQGLNNDQLRELTTTVALADEVFHGAGPNVNYLTQALNAFDVAAGDANMTTIELVNASRASGQPLNQMLMAMIQLGPAFRQMGYDAEQSAMFLGDMTKSGEPLARIAFAFNDVVTSFQKHGITDTHAAWTELIDTMRADVLAGHDELASQLAAKYTITPRAITMLIDAMHKGRAAAAGGTHRGAAAGQPAHLDRGHHRQDPHPARRVDADQQHPARSVGAAGCGPGVRADHDDRPCPRLAGDKQAADHQLGRPDRALGADRYRRPRRGGVLRHQGGRADPERHLQDDDLDRRRRRRDDPLGVASGDASAVHRPRLRRRRQRQRRYREQVEDDQRVQLRRQHREVRRHALPHRQRFGPRAGPQVSGVRRAPESVAGDPGRHHHQVRGAGPGSCDAAADFQPRD